MPELKLLKKYADLAVKVGANVQKDQMLVIKAPTDSKELVRLLVEAGYDAGARSVIVMWEDPYVARLSYDGKTVEALEDIPQWKIDEAQYYIDQNSCIISISSPVPGLNSGVDPLKLQMAGLAQMKALKFALDHMMSNVTQWNIIAAPNNVWAKQVFPNLSEAEAVEALWEAILKASRVTETNDPIEEWKEHNNRLVAHNKDLTKYQFESLHFSNTLGTDLTIQLVDNHIWAGGIEKSADDVSFNPNIPTEENFTMPHKYGVNGKVVATKPLNYQGNLIENFWLEFKDGKVINYGAEKQIESLKNLLNVDQGSSYLGEVALISFDSPINITGILFLNTLFDENASCHLALGRAYLRTINNGHSMTKDELEKAGCNQSMVHADFMFGSKDLQITGTMKDGQKVIVFKDGDYQI